MADPTGEKTATLLAVRLEEQTRSNNWQHIETALKDGTPILTYRSVKLMAVAAWLRGYDCLGCWCVTDGMILANVTHWMPLPEPPEGTTK